MAGAAPPPLEPHDDEPVSPELVMTDPALAHRQAMVPAVWETVRAAQQAARDAPEPAGFDSTGRRRPRPWWLLAVALAAGAAALVLLRGTFSSGPETRAVKIAPSPAPVAHHVPLRHAKPALLRPHANPAVSRTHPKPAVPKQHPKLAVPKQQPKIAAPAKPAARVKPHPSSAVAKRPVAPPVVAKPRPVPKAS